MPDSQPVSRSETWARQFPMIILDPNGSTYVLASTETEALAEAVGNYGEEINKVIAAGWMCKVAYPDGYDSREEWEQSSDFNESWWEGCAEPINARQRAIRAWEVIFNA